MSSPPLIDFKRLSGKINVQYLRKFYESGGKAAALGRTEEEVEEEVEEDEEEAEEEAEVLKLMKVKQEKMDVD